jgi:hypothetical protein
MKLSHRTHKVLAIWKPLWITSATVALILLTEFQRASLWGCIKN